jgi:glycine/D-amino acid oxidase-like deaminating enzyme
MAQTDCDAIILGGGAAGLMCAIEAGRRGRRVIVLERNREPARKILISGGGRCNFTNRHCPPEHYLSARQHQPSHPPDNRVGGTSDAKGGRTGFNSLGHDYGPSVQGWMGRLLFEYPF